MSIQSSNGLVQHPLISIITPVYNTPLRVLKECIESVQAQSYRNWELCLVDDKSPNPECRELIKRYADRDSRIRYSFRDNNGGIVAASNDALSLAKGEFVGLLDHDDVLEPDAIEQVINVFINDDTVDYVYTDEDLLDERGVLYSPFRKPDWSPERFRNQMYVCHFSVIRRSLVDNIEGFREGFDGSQDYDLILRVTEKARKTHHIPIILYHWRVSSVSVASNPYAKPYAYDAGERALVDHLGRMGISGTVERRHDLPGNYRITRSGPNPQSVDVLLTGERRNVDFWGSIVDSFDLTKWSLNTHSTFRNLQIVDVSTSNEDICSHTNRFFSESESDFIVVCSDGTALSTDGSTMSFDWCERFLGFMQLADVAMVSGYTWTAGSRLKHCALSVGPKELWFDGIRMGQNVTGIRALFRCDREVSALLPYFVMIRRQHFIDAGGLDTTLPPPWAWIDLCLKFRSNNLRLVSTPQVHTYDFSNDSDVIEFNEAKMDITSEIDEKWSHLLQRDPYSVLRPEQRVHSKPKWKAK
jgi:glycosyltransferase involved in cell wall biosynthesis